MTIRKELKLRVLELIKSGMSDNKALNQARQEMNTKYGKDWRDKEREKIINKFLSEGGKLDMSYH